MGSGDFMALLIAEAARDERTHRGRESRRMCDNQLTACARVLEQIVTDQGAQTAAQIEALRPANHLTSTDATA